MSLYVEANILKKHAEAHESSDEKVWELLAAAVSRIFDRAANVEPDFFAKTEPEAATEVEFRANGTRFLDISPYHAGTLVQVADSNDVVIDTDDYFEKNGFLLFDYDIADETIVKVTAKFGFDSVPADIEQACVEQALFMWRRKDLSFTEMSGVATAAITSPLSPTFQIISANYRARYESFFA